MNIIIRTADQTRKAELDLDPGFTGADVIQTAVSNWTLPTDTDYTLMNVTKNKTILPSGKIIDVGTEEGDILEIQPVLVAGV